MSNRAARDFDGSIPEYYDRYMGPAQPPGDVLEIACGTGIVTRRLRERLDPPVRLVATDLSRAMLDYARAKLAGSPGIEWREADVAALPFVDAAFGAVVCAFGIMLVADKPAAFRQMRRVLREGGALLFNVWDSIDENAHARASDEVVVRSFPAIPSCSLPAFLTALRPAADQRAACRSRLPRVAHRESDDRDPQPERARLRDRADQGHAALDPVAAAWRLARRSHKKARRRAGAHRRRRAVSLPGAGAGRGGPGGLTC